MDLEKVKFSDNSYNWLRFLDLKRKSKILYLGGSGLFVQTFTEIWKMLFTWSLINVQILPLKIEFIGYLLFFLFQV